MVVTVLAERRLYAAAPAAKPPAKPFFDQPGYRSVFDADRERAFKGEQEQARLANERKIVKMKADAATAEAAQLLARANPLFKPKIAALEAQVMSLQTGLSR